MVGQRFKPYYYDNRIPWKQAVARVRGAFAVLTKVEDLTIVSCETEPFFWALGATAVDDVLLGLRRLKIYVGYGTLDVLALIQCARVRKEHSRPLGEVTIVFENEPGADVIREMKSLGEFVEELDYRVGVTPELDWGDQYGEQW